MKLRHNRIMTDALREIRHTRSRFLSLLVLSALSVCFLAGLRATAPDMKNSADLYFDQQRLMDLRITSTLGLTEEDAAALEGFFDRTARVYARYVSADASFAELQGALVGDTEFYNSLRTFDSSWYVSHDSTAFEDFSVSELESLGPDAAAGTVRFTYMVYKEGLRPRSYPSVYRMYAVRGENGWKLLDLQVQ